MEQNVPAIYQQIYPLFVCLAPVNVLFLIFFMKVFKHIRILIAFYLFLIIACNATYIFNDNWLQAEA